MEKVGEGRGIEGASKIKLKAMIKWVYTISPPLFIALLIAEFLIFSSGVIITYLLSFSMQGWEALRSGQGDGGYFYSYLYSSTILVSLLSLLALVRIYLRRRFMLKVVARASERVIGTIFSEDLHKLVTSSRDGYYPWLTNDLNWIRGSVLSIISSLGGLARFFAVTTLLFVVNFKVFLISVGVSLLLTLLPLFFKRTLERLGERINKLENELTSKAHNLLRGYHVFLLANKLTLLPLVILNFKTKKYNQTAGVLLKNGLLFYLLFILLGAVNLSLAASVGYLIYLGTIPLAGALFIEGFTLIVFSSLFEFIRNIQEALRSRHIFEKYLILAQETGEGEGEATRLSGFECIELSNLTYEEGGREILKGLNLTFKRGKSYAIVGRSGVGKTTLALIILGILRPTSGKISWDGRDYLELKEGDVLRSSSLALSQGGLLAQSLRANLSFKEESEGHEDEEGVLASLGLDQLSLGEGVGRLSSGEEQRIKLARVLLEPRQLILLDEALANLDKVRRGVVMNQLRALPNTTLIHLTHHIDRSEDYDEVIELK